MPRWTEEQQQAIDLENSNILVSAGAGSGKTAVLSERALRKVKEGVNIDQILILTFTKAAAYEMMLRIRNKISKAGLTKQLNRIDKAYITTFDSFALSVVKKYHDRLNLSQNITIVDENVINLLKKETVDEIFDYFYKNSNPHSFTNFHKSRCNLSYLTYTSWCRWNIFPKHCLYRIYNYYIRLVIFNYIFNIIEISFT